MRPQPRKLIEDLRNAVDKAQRMAQVPSDDPAMVFLKRIIETKIDALEREASASSTTLCKPQEKSNK